MLWVSRVISLPLQNSIGTDSVFAKTTPYVFCIESKVRTLQNSGSKRSSGSSSSKSSTIWNRFLNRAARSSTMVTASSEAIARSSCDGVSGPEAEAQKSIASDCSDVEFSGPVRTGVFLALPNSIVCDSSWLIAIMRGNSLHKR